jgi:hypothetical protein
MIISFAFAVDRVKGDLIIQLQGDSRTNDISLFTADYSNYELVHKEVLSVRLNIHLFSLNEDVINGIVTWKLR